MFGAGAARLAGICAALWGWPPDRFWRATPAEVAGVVAAMLPGGADEDRAPVTRGLLEQLEKSCG